VNNISANNIGIANDHAAVELKNIILASSLLQDYTWVDYGCHLEDGRVDYPDYASYVVKALLKREIDVGICLCGTGIGMSMTANRYGGIRAACVWDIATAKASRKHNDANILCLGARLLDHKKVPLIVQTWLRTEFSHGRHKKRLAKLEDITASAQSTSL